MAAAAKAVKPIVTKCFSTQRVGVVISAGKIPKAVKVRISDQEWNKKFQKHFRAHHDYMVSDPNNSLVEGDLVRISSGNRTSKTIRHTVTAIVSPFGEPVENRPPVMSQAQLDELRVQKRLLKDVRRAERGRYVSKRRLADAKEQGLRIPTLEEALEGTRLTEADLKARGLLGDADKERKNKKVDKKKGDKAPEADAEASEKAEKS